MRVYVPVTGLATVLVLVGFWPTYFGPLLMGAVDKAMIIHVHAAVYMGWLMLVLAQGYLAAIGRTALHVRVGRFGMAYGLLAILIGLVTAFRGFERRIEAGKIQLAQRALLAPLADMIVFSLFLGAAWVYRRKPDIHKRLIIVATTTLIDAAVARMPFWYGMRDVSFREVVPSLLVWLSPIYVAMAHDYFRRKIVHPVYVLGIACLILLRLRPLLRDTDAWMSFSGWLATFFA